MANNPPAPPEKTFNSMFRRFFDIPDSEPVWPTQRPVPRSSSTIWSGAAGEENGEERDTIAKRRLERAKSTTNLRISTTSNHTHPNPNISHFSSATRSANNSSTSLVTGTASRFRNPFCSHTSSNTASAATTPPPTPDPGNGGGRGATGTSFELTPLSGLIQQSFKDIEVLKRVHASKAKNGGGNVTAGGFGGGKVEKGKGKGKQKASEGAEGGEVGVTIDFERVEENLRRFEEVYRQFLASGTPHGAPGEEVHLVAMVCKRSEVVKGKLAGGEGVPKARVPDCCL